ncbi:hypothetical protein Tco_0281140 [Tanacetum coccineum]
MMPLTSKIRFLLILHYNPQHIDEFDLKDETSLSKYNEVEQNILYFNDLFPFNIIYPDDLKSDKDNDDNKINIIRTLGGNENTQGLKRLLKASHDKINKIFIMERFVMELDVNIMAWNYLNNVMLLNLIKNLYVPFSIPFDPKRYYKDDVYTRILRRPKSPYGVSYLNTPSAQSAKNFEMKLGKIYKREVHRVQVFNFGGLTDLMAEELSGRMLMEHRDPRMLRLMHRLIARALFSRIAEFQAPEKEAGAMIIGGLVATAGAFEIAEGASDVVEGDQAISTPVQVSLREQREVVDAMARDFSKFTVWVAKGISQLLDSVRATYV